MDSSEIEIKDEKKYYCALCQVSFGCQKAWDSQVHGDCKFYHMHQKIVNQKKTKKAKKKAKFCEKQKTQSDLNGNRNEIRSEIQNYSNKNQSKNKRKRERRKKRHEKKFEEANKGLLISKCSYNAIVRTKISTMFLSLYKEVKSKFEKK